MLDSKKQKIYSRKEHHTSKSKSGSISKTLFFNHHSSTLSQSNNNRLAKHHHPHTLFRTQIKILSKNLSKYSTSILDYNKIIINNLLISKDSHRVAVFKDYMIADYIDEFLRRQYSISECKERIPKFANYYKNYLTFFCKPIFRNFIFNAIVQCFGEAKAEIYYNKNYGNKKRKKKKTDLVNDKYKTLFSKSIKKDIDENSIITQGNAFDNDNQDLIIGKGVVIVDDNTMILDGDSKIIYNSGGNKRISGNSSLISFLNVLDGNNYNKYGEFSLKKNNFKSKESSSKGKAESRGNSGTISCKNKISDGGNKAPVRRGSVPRPSNLKPLEINNNNNAYLNNNLLCYFEKEKNESGIEGNIVNVHSRNCEGADRGNIYMDKIYNKTTEYNTNFNYHSNNANMNTNSQIKQSKYTLSGSKNTDRYRRCTTNANMGSGNVISNKDKKDIVSSPANNNMNNMNNYYKSIPMSSRNKSTDITSKNTNTYTQNTKSNKHCNITGNNQNLNSNSNNANNIDLNDLCGTNKNQNFSNTTRSIHKEGKDKTMHKYTNTVNFTEKYMNTMNPMNTMSPMSTLKTSQNFTLKSPPHAYMKKKQPNLNSNNLNNNMELKTYHVKTVSSNFQSSMNAYNKIIKKSFPVNSNNNNMNLNLNNKQKKGYANMNREMNNHSNKDNENCSKNTKSNTNLIQGGSSLSNDGLTNNTNTGQSMNIENIMKMTLRLCNTKKGPITSNNIIKKKNTASNIESGNSNQNVNCNCKNINENASKDSNSNKGSTALRSTSTHNHNISNVNSNINNANREVNSHTINNFNININNHICFSENQNSNNSNNSNSQSNTTNNLNKQNSQNQNSKKLNLQTYLDLNNGNNVGGNNNKLSRNKGSQLIGTKTEVVPNSNVHGKNNKIINEKNTNNIFISFGENETHRKIPSNINLNNNLMSNANTNLNTNNHSRKISQPNNYNVTQSNQNLQGNKGYFGHLNMNMDKKEKCYLKTCGNNEGNNNFRYKVNKKYK